MWYILLAYFIYNSLYLLISSSSLVSLTFALATGNHYFFSLYLWVCLFFVIFTSLLYFLGSTCKWYHTVVVFLWLISLSIIPAKSINVASNGKILFFLWLSNIPLCVCIISFKIYSSVDRHVGFFHILATLNNAAMSIFELVFFFLHYLFKLVFFFSWIHTQEWNCWVIW